MSDNSKIITALLVGAAVGAAVGYFIASDDKDKALETLGDSITSIKDKLRSHIETGRNMVNHVADKAEELLNTSETEA
jgi:hypothetical protein